MEWILCKDCIYFEDCTEKESRDGCYHGFSKNDPEFFDDSDEDIGSARVITAEEFLKKNNLEENK